VTGAAARRRQKLEQRSRACKFTTKLKGVALAMLTKMTLRLEDDVKARLDKLAGATRRSKSFLAAEAIREFVENNEWQIGEIKAALKAANAGDFATDAEVAAVAKRWKLNAL
jgi:RHH-type rel operon transcriptional repressor/antitoxin RelB